MGGEGESERFDAGGHETQFLTGDDPSRSDIGMTSAGVKEEKSGGWWPFGGGGSS